MEQKDLQAHLRGLATKGKVPMDAPDAATATPTDVATAPQPTTNFSAKSEAEKEAERKERAARNARNSDVTSRITDTATKIDTPQGILMRTISQNAVIAGYITKNGPKLDFFHKRHPIINEDGSKSKDNVEFEIRLKQYPPSKIEGVIVVYPAKALTALMNGDFKSDTVAEATSDVESKIVRIEKYPELPAILTSRTAGYLVEAKEIFEPYITTKRNIAAYGDAPQVYKNLPQKPCLYASLKLGQLSSENASIYRVKHSYRSRIATPKNIISLNQYETVQIKDVYSDAEAREMIELYLSKWTRSSNGKPVVKYLTADSKKNFDVIESGDANIIERTRFFPTDLNESWYTSNTVDHWYDRTPVGAPRPLTKAELQLVKKIPSQKAGANARPVSRALKGPDASADSYRFDPQGMHKAIVDATGGKLSFDDIITFTPASSRTKSATSNVPTTLVGSQLMGTDAETLRKILLGTFGVKPPKQGK